jgi:hypothetical protein
MTAAAASGAELELLLACARVELTPADRRRAEAAIGATVDWSRVADLAGAHGLLPLLHRHVASGAVTVPPSAAAALRVRALAASRRMLQRAAELADILRLYGDRGIAVVPLKGPVLAEQVYGSVTLRQPGDLDLLVREGDVARGMQALEERGYRPLTRASKQLTDLARQDLHHVIAEHPVTKIRIELHYLLFRPRGRRRFTFDAIEPYLRPRSFMGVPVSVFEGDELLAYLCEHGAGHTWGRLEWLATVAELLRRQGGVFDAGRSRFAQELGVRRRALAAQRLIAFLDGAGPTGGARERAIDRANRVVLARLRRSPERITETSGERLRYLLGTDASLAARLRRCVTMVLAPSIADREAVPLPGWLLPLHWALRPFRLVARQAAQR